MDEQINTAPTKAPRLLDKVRNAIRRKHYSPRTEETYIHWIKRFIYFHGKRHPLQMGEAEVTAFIVGRRPAAHGSGEMPVWGPLFRELNPYDSRIDARLSRLVEYLKSIQVK